MIPATTIQPYDAAIRGVGRNFRNLGGDPGVATYMNGIYSEDLYTATIGSFWDIDRIEVLRGPQGTLYGRNAVGGAMNFLYNKPTEEFEFAAKAIAGSYGTQDAYGMVSGTLIEDVLTARLIGSSRQHDGYIQERSGLGPDLDSGDETNVALSLEWKINDNMTVNLRSNQADVDRVMGSADGAGLIMFTGENSQPGNDGLRSLDRVSNFLRPVDSAQVNPLASDFQVPGQQVFTYTNPTTGAPISAQFARNGIEASDHGVNYAAGITGRDPGECVFSDRSNIDGDDLCAFTNGKNYERFDQQGNQLEFSWDISDSLSFKYLFGYNEFFYDRVTDRDGFDSQIEDRQFYVNQEAEYMSHEFQLFWEMGDSLTFTSGIFLYDSTLDQRWDFYSEAVDANGQPSGRYGDPTYGLDNFLAVAAPGAVPGDPPLGFLTGRTTPISLESVRADGALAPAGSFSFSAGPWFGDLASVRGGPETYGSDVTVESKTEREAFAAYTQGVWDINEKFTLTAGIRYATDDLYGEEVLARYSETQAIIPAVGTNLATVNIVRGAIDPATLLPTGTVTPWQEGVPISFGGYRRLERTDSKVTWRLNLDYNLSDDTLLYGGVTTGFRGGGFNLSFFSQTPEFEPEELTAYEIGYKSQLLNNSLQLNASAYVYAYDSIHTSTEEACPAASDTSATAIAIRANSACSVSTSTTSIQAAPGADVSGFELEVLWLATDALTLGGNLSLTKTEYTGSFIVIDGADPSIPGALYTSENNSDRARDLQGLSLPQIPDTKYSLYATYGFDLGDAGTLDLFSTYSYIDDVYFAAFQNPLDLAPAYARVDLRATWMSRSEEWQVSAFVNNVQNEIGIRQIQRGNEDEGFRRSGQVTEPRVYGVELAYTLR
jgi:iron complex outermembrane receptor protein